MGREQAKEAARKSEKCFVRQSGQVELTIAAVLPQPVFPPLSTHTHHPSTLSVLGTQARPRPRYEILSSCTPSLAAK